MDIYISKSYLREYIVEHPIVLCMYHQTFMDAELVFLESGNANCSC